MADRPKSVRINEAGSRDGVPFEPSPIATAHMLALLDARSEPGLSRIETGIGPDRRLEATRRRRMPYRICIKR